MAVTPNNIVTPQGLNSGGTTIVNADSTNKKTLITAGANGTVVQGLGGVSDDTAAVNVRIFIHDGTTDFQVGTTRLAIAAGTDGATNSVDLLNSLACPWVERDGAGNAALYLEAGWSLKVAALAAVTAAKTVTIFAHGKDF